MDVSQKKTNTRLILIVVAVIAVIVIVGGAAFLLFGKNSTSSNSGSNGQVSTKQRLNDQADQVAASLKQSQTSQANAKTAIGDTSKQIKVGR